MQLEVQEFKRAPGTSDDDSSYRAVSEPRRMEYGAGDSVDLALRSNGYQSPWSPDFIQKAGLKPISRFYHALRVAVDLDVSSVNKALLRQRRDLCYANGFGYLAIPVGLKQDSDAVYELYQQSLVNYHQYEKLHPRPRAVQEITVTDAAGNTRKAEVPVTTIEVGGRVLVGPSEQAAALQQARPTTQEEKTRDRQKNAAFSRLQQAVAEKIPSFRNPYRADGTRHLPMEYSA